MFVYRINMVLPGYDNSCVWIKIVILVFKKLFYDDATVHTKYRAGFLHKIYSVLEIAIVLKLPWKQLCFFRFLLVSMWKSGISWIIVAKWHILLLADYLKISCTNSYRAGQWERDWLAMSSESVGLYFTFCFLSKKLR